MAQSPKYICEGANQKFMVRTGPSSPYYYQGKNLEPNLAEDQRIRTA